MSTASWKTGESGAQGDLLGQNKGKVAWISFLLALLQSICGAVVAVNGLRLAIGIGSLVLSSGISADVARFHSDQIRIPMILLAIAGSVVNLAVLAHVRSLRNRPAAQWRREEPSARTIREERLQIGLAVLTFVLVGVEEVLHYRYHHHL